MKKDCFKRLRIISVVVMIFCLGACAPTITITKPDRSVSFDLSKIEFVAPKASNPLIYKAINGKNSSTQDNVSVEVNSILSEVDGKDYSVNIKCPDGASYNYGLFPMMVVLKIQNNTDHIVTLERTIVRLEDANKNEYPMATTIGENKRHLANKISRSYDDYTEKLNKLGIETFKQILAEQYKPKYEAMVKEIDDAKKKGAQIRTPETEKGYYMTEVGINNLLKEYSPEGVFNKYIGQIQSQLSEQIGNVATMKAEALKQINELPDSVKNVITSGVYQPINVLPGRSEKVIVPFSAIKEGDRISVVNVNIFDLPTQVNQAGVPTKRANFYFEMVAEETK